MDATSKYSPPQHTGRLPHYIASDASTTPVTGTGLGQHSTPLPDYSTSTPLAYTDATPRRPDMAIVWLVVAAICMAYSLIWGF